MKYRKIEVKETGYGFSVKACGRDGLWQGCDRLTVRIPETDRRNWVDAFRATRPRSRGAIVAAMLASYPKSFEIRRTLTRVIHGFDCGDLTMRAGATGRDRP